MNPIKDLIRRQIELEDEQRSLGASRYNARKLPWRVEAGTIDEEANLPPGQHLLRELTTPVAEAFKDFIDECNSGKAGRRHSASDLLMLCDPIEAAYLSLRVILNRSTNRESLVSTARAVSKALVENLEFKAFREINRLGYRGYMRKQEARGYSRQRRSAVKKLFDSEGVDLGITLSLSEETATGLKCVELVCESTSMFTLDTIPRSKGYIQTVRPTETLETWLGQQHGRCSLLAPVHMPMLVRPRRWRSPTYGGYLTPRPGNRLVKQRNPAYTDELRGYDLDKVYAAVNHIQETPWQINRRVLDVIEQVWDGGSSLGALPQRLDDPIPAKPADLEFDAEVRKTWKAEAAAAYQRNAERQSARIALQQGLWTARRFQDEDAIFFPHELDFRGRVYPIPISGPSPQGCDWQKALLQFAYGKPLGLQGFRWLCVHIANLFGVDKVSLKDREAWVLENFDALMDSGQDPLDGNRFWAAADDPYCALAACMEFAEAALMDDPSKFVSRIPVALDGSCSGLQHFSAMLRDEDGGRAVNLLPADTPQDIYAQVAKYAQDQAETSTDESALPWRGGKVVRKIAKRPTMTFCYSATRFGMQAMILQTLREIDKDNEVRGLPPHLDGADNYPASVWLSHVLFEAIEETVTAAARAMDWLRAAAKVASEEGLPLWWDTPLGLPILQEYNKPVSKRLKLHWAGRRLDLQVNSLGSVLDKRSQANGVAPNFVHSLDAAHLQAVALRCQEEGIDHLAMIHDSFGTHAADTDRISQVIRDTFVEQYSGDVLGEFYEALKDQLSEEQAEKLPVPPVMGSLELNAVREASFAFA